MISRRGLLLGGGGVVGVAALAGRHYLDTPSSPHPVPDGPVGTRVSGSFRSAAMSRVVGWSIAYPARPSAMPFVLELHGKGGDHNAAFDHQRYDHFLFSAAFAMVTVDGGADTYYHRRASGLDPAAMIVDELLPVLRDRGLDTSRFALAGWSMGGYGAVLLSEQLGSARVAALAVDSPAIWTSVSSSAPGAFDSAADFAAHDVLRGAGRLSGIPVRITCGTSDPLLPGARALLSAVPGAEHEFGPGAHNTAWWQHAAPGQLAFVGKHLT